MKYLTRFLSAQERNNFSSVIQELKFGKKASHWMGYIFPQLRGLGRSNESFIYGIIGINEAEDYLAHPVLSARLKECCEAILIHEDKSSEDIFGIIDSRKLRSSMTLFAYISEEKSVFHKVLNQFFGGKQDELTLSLLKDNNKFNIINGEFLGYYGTEEDLVIPQGVTSIHKLAFYKNIYLHSVTLPEGLVSIGELAFTCCRNLQRVDVPKSLRFIGHGAFNCCNNLADENGFVIINDIVFDCYLTDKTEIYVPQGITSIEEYAFSKCWKNMHTIYLPASLTTIEPLAFYECENLTDIIIPESVTYIADNAFSKCRNITFHAYKGSYAEAFAKAKGFATATK